jgi:hypothetical protein
MYVFLSNRITLGVVKNDFLWIKLKIRRPKKASITFYLRALKFGPRNVISSIFNSPTLVTNVRDKMIKFY